MKKVYCIVLCFLLLLVGCKSTDEGFQTNNNEVEIEKGKEAKTAEEPVDPYEGLSVNEKTLAIMHELADSGNEIEAVLSSSNYSYTEAGYQDLVNYRQELIDKNRTILNSMLDKAYSEKDFVTLNKLFSGAAIIFDPDRKAELKVLRQSQGEFHKEGDSNFSISINGYEATFGGNAYELVWVGDKIVNSHYVANAFNLKDSGIYVSGWGNYIYFYDGDEEITLYTDAGEQIKQKYDIEKEMTDKPKIGMTKEQVINTKWGEPSKRNIDEYEWGTFEQWVYPNYRYVYFENGIVTSVSYSE